MLIDNESETRNMEESKKTVKKRSALSPAVDAEFVTPAKKKKEIDAAFSEIQFKFLLRDEDTVSKGLEQFLEVADAYTDGVACQDIVEAYCKSSPGCAELLTLLDVTQKKLKAAQISLVFDCLRHILIRIRGDLESFSSCGEIIVQRILAAHMAQIYNSLRDQNKSNAVKAAIQLLIAIVMLNDRSKKAVQARFNFDHHVFPTLFARRNRKDPADIRSCLVLFTMAFVLDGDQQVVNSLVQQKTFLQLTISGLKYDAKEVVVDVLATLLDKVVRGVGISKTLKIKLFSEKVLKQLCGLYKWEGPGGWSKDGGGRKRENAENRLMEQEGFKEERDIIAATVHEFLCELCTSQKYGIVFFDKSFGTSERNQNQILTHLLQFLSGTLEEPLKRNLALGIMTSCPDQVEHFLPHLDTFLTPRWSEKWKIYMDFMIEVYENLATVPSFVSTSDIQSKDVQTIVTMTSPFCLPPSKLWPVMSHAIKHEDLRVRHHSLLLVQVMLRKCEAIYGVFKSDKISKMVSAADSLALTFLTAVTKALPSPAAIFQCVDKVMELLNSQDKDRKMQTDIDLAEHLITILKILIQYQTLIPSMLSERPRDIVKLINTVGKLQTLSQKKVEPSVDMEMELDADCAEDLLATEEDPKQKSSLAQIYLLELLSETDSREISLGREGLLEKLLKSAHQNVKGQHCDQIISLVCKMLTRLDAFTRHSKELNIWISWALMMESTNVSELEEQKILGKHQTKRKKNEDKESPVSHDPAALSFSCISFLSRCLATLINDPVPYLDRVTEAMVDATSSLSSDQDVESSSAGTNEGAIDAILLTDDSELDQLVGNSSSKLDTRTSPVTVNEAPISPLAVIALDNLQYSKSDSPSMAQYLSTVLIHTLHIQVEPAVLSTVVKKSKGKLCPGVREYLEGWAVPIKKKLPKFHLISEKIIFGLCSNLMMWLMSSPEGTKMSVNLMEGLDSELLSLSFLEKTSVLDQAVFYMTQSTKWKGLDPKEQRQRLKTLQIVSEAVFCAIVKNLTDKEREIKPPSETSDTKVDGEILDKAVNQQEPLLLSKNENQEKICTAVESILGHTTLSNHFLLQAPETSKSPKKNVLFVSKTISEFICKILQRCKTLNLTSSYSGLFDCYLKSALNSLKNGQDITPCMNSLEAIACHMDLPELTRCVCDILQAPLSLFLEDRAHAGDKLSPLSSAGQIFIQIIARWLKLVESHSSKADSFLFPWSTDQAKFWTDVRNMTRQSFPKLERKASSDSGNEKGRENLQQDESKEEPVDSTSLLPLDMTGLRPLFELLSHCEEVALMSEICRLVSLVPSTSSACSADVFKYLVEGCLSCSETRQQLVRLLMLNNKEFYTPCGDFIVSKVKVVMKKGAWWLMASYLEGAKHDKALDKTRPALIRGVQGLIKQEVGQKDEDFWKFLNLLVSPDLGSDVACRLSIYNTVQAFVKDNASSASESQFDLLHHIVCSLEEKGRNEENSTNEENSDKFEEMSCDVKKKGVKELKISSQATDLSHSFLDFALKHLIFLLSKKANRDLSFEEKILDSVIATLYLKKRVTLNFVSRTWTSFVKTSLKSLFKNPKLLRVLALLVPTVYSKRHDKVTTSDSQSELDAKSMFQLCLSHTSFLSTLLSESAASAKEELVHLLYSLFLIDHECVEDKIGNVFMTAYSASLSQTDQRLLHMMQAFIQGAEVKEEIPVLWGNAALEHRSTCKSLGPSLDTAASLKTFLDQIDPVRMSKTILHFPQRRNCENFSCQDSSHFMSLSDCYDPNHLLRVFIQILSPDKIVPVHQFVAKDCLGFLLVSLTSHHQRTRLMAYRALNEFYSHLDSSRCFEKQELAYVLDLLNASRMKDNQRLPFVVALFLARVVRLMLYPSDHMYLTLLKFLTAKPEMDLSNVPEFYKLFFSSDSHFRQERNWILTLLRDGIRDSSDYWLYQKKVIFRIILAFFNSSMGDEVSQSLVLETLRNACQQKSTCVDLVKEHGLMSWLTTSVNKLKKRPYLVNTFCSLLHTIWFSLSSKAFSAQTPTEKGYVTSKKLSLNDGNEKNTENSDKSGTKQLNKMEIEDLSDTEEADTHINSAKSSLAKNEKKMKHAKKMPTVPKSTIAEMGLVVKYLLWHLKSASSCSVFKLIQVIESLGNSASHLHQQPHDPKYVNEAEELSSQSTGPAFSPDGNFDISLKSRLLTVFKLSPVETYALVYFTAKSVDDGVSMMKASKALQCYHISIESVLGDPSVADGTKKMTRKSETLSPSQEKMEQMEVEEEEEVEGTKVDEMDVAMEMGEADTSGKLQDDEKVDDIDPFDMRTVLHSVLFKPLTSHS